MRILHVLQNYYPSFGGTQYLFQKISEKLVNDYGDDVTVFTTNSMVGPNNPEFIPIKPLKEKINGVKVQRFKFRRWHQTPFRLVLKANRYLKFRLSERLSFLKSGPWSPSMIRGMQEFDGDVICASSSKYLYMYYPIIRKLCLKNIPFVYMGAIHFDDVSDMKISTFVRKAIQASNAYIANTDFEKRALINLGIDAKKIFVVGCGVDLSDFYPDRSASFRENHNLDTATPLVGYIGRHALGKGIDTLIDAMAEVWNILPQTRLLIAGAETAYTKEIKQKIALLTPKHQEKIIYHPNISNEFKFDLFNACDIVVNASKSESFGIVYLEAWACKKPVIGCTIEAVKSVVTNGVDGLLVEPDDYKQLARHINSLLMDPQKRIEMGAAGYSKVKELYTWDIIAAKYRSVYQFAINTVRTPEINN